MKRSIRQFYICKTKRKVSLYYYYY